MIGNLPNLILKMNNNKMWLKKGAKIIEQKVLISDDNK